MNSLWQGRDSHLDVIGCDLSLDVGVLSVEGGCQGESEIRGGIAMTNAEMWNSFFSKGKPYRTILS